jgi:ribonuclease-3
MQDQAMVAHFPRDIPIQDIATSLGIAEEDLPPELLEEALTHRSRTQEVGGRDYERLEFLGDAVLGLIVAEHLFRHLPEAQPGGLTDRRRSLVSGLSLSTVGARLGLSQPGCIRVGQGAWMQEHYAEDSTVEGVLEALIGAAFVHGGLEAARRLVLAWGIALPAGASVVPDPKSRLKERAEASGVQVRWITKDQSGHGGGPWTAQAWIGEECWGEGEGRRKKEAEQLASQRALDRLEGEAGGRP